ncbi:uncharacterized protein KIAA1143 homolog [Ornithodoros turicata]
MPRHNVTCIKPSDPPFIKKMKERIGYTEGPTVDTKRETLAHDLPADREDREDEKPVVVVMKAGDLTAEEADAVRRKQEEDAPNDGKIVYSKPSKRKDEDEQGITATSTKKLKEKDTVNRSKVAAVKDNRLLSFGDDEEDSDDL